MNTEAIFNAAHSTAIRIMESGTYVTPSDTVCSIQTASGRVYTGISRTDMNNPLHAEVDAVSNMLAAGERIIVGLLLIGTQTRSPLLPCNSCLGYILSLAIENSGCMIMLQDRMISINEVGRFAAPMGGMPQNQNYGGHTPVKPQFSSTHAVAAAPMNPPPPVSFSQPAEPEINAVQGDTSATAENATGDLLKNKVNSLLRVADDTDEFLESLPTKKKKFGIFKK